MEEALELYTEAVVSKGRTEAEKALQCIGKAYAENPGEPLIAAYYADCLSLVGRGALDTASMFGNAMKAIKIYDELLIDNSHRIELRLLRGAHSFRVPEAFFRRTVTAIDDFEYLIGRYEEDSTLFSEGLYHNILYLLGKAYQRLGMESESQSVWEKLLTLSSDSKYAELVKRNSNRYSEEASYTIDTRELSDREIFREGKRLYNLGLEGDAAAAQKAEELLRKVYEANPDVPIVEGYYGSSIALAGKSTGDFQALFGSAVKGIKHLNHAVDNDLDNVKLRLLRADLFYNLPEAFFHLNEKTIKDYVFLAEAYRNKSGHISEEQYREVLYNLGMCYKRSNRGTEADEIWKELSRITTDPKYSLLVKGKMERRGEE